LDLFYINFAPAKVKSKQAQKIKMEFKMNVNVVMSKDLTIEAESLREAMNKAQEMMAQPKECQEHTITKILFGERPPYNMSNIG
jgi:hypothetical protein